MIVASAAPKNPIVCSLNPTRASFFGPLGTWKKHKAFTYVVIHLYGIHDTTMKITQTMCET